MADMMCTPPVVDEVASIDYGGLAQVGRLCVAWAAPERYIRLARDPSNSRGPGSASGIVSMSGPTSVGKFTTFDLRLNLAWGLF